MLVAGLVVFFSVMNSGGTVGVRSLFVKFCCTLMRIVRHDGPFYHTITADQKFWAEMRLGRCTVLDVPVALPSTGDTISER